MSISVSNDNDCIVHECDDGADNDDADNEDDGDGDANDNVDYDDDANDNDDCDDDANDNDDDDDGGDDDEYDDIFWQLPCLYSVCGQNKQLFQTPSVCSCNKTAQPNKIKKRKLRERQRFLSKLPIKYKASSKKVLLKDDFDKCWVHLMNRNGSPQWKFSKLNFKLMEIRAKSFHAAINI